MRPKIGIEPVPYLLRVRCRALLHAESLGEVAADSRSQREEPLDDKKFEQLRKETLSRNAWT